MSGWVAGPDIAVCSAGPDIAVYSAGPDIAVYSASPDIAVYSANIAAKSTVLTTQHYAIAVI